VRKIRPLAIRAADADHANAKAQLRAHLKMCGQCSRAVRCDRYAQTCDIGWSHLRYERITAAQLRATVKDHAASAPAQLVLF
jgi:hypothetical protein